ncbi:MAG: response regulator [Phycisphaerae bacterium]|nr:response regulator [Phycisphaerae bacterium]
MLPASKPKPSPNPTKPCVLIVDDEPALVEMVNDILGKSLDCRMLAAKNLSEAQRMMRHEKTIELLIADVHLPDGDGIALLPALRDIQPQAAAVIMTGDRSVQGAVEALRAGAMDFLPKPFSANDLLDRIRRALDRQRIQARETKRNTRLKAAVKRLNASRRTVSRKVDLLCNDLIVAYGELSKQMDEVRVGGQFTRLLESAKDLEQLLCHTMDWILRRIGYSNVAIWLASEENEFELGAYMKYTIPGEPSLTDAMRRGLLKHVMRENVVRMGPTEIAERLSKAEATKLKDQNILGVNCTYLGDPLAAFILFRDQKAPFTDEDAKLIESIAPIFSIALAGSVRETEGDDDSEEAGPPGEPPKRKDPRNDADWWKTGGPPPY